VRAQAELTTPPVRPRAAATTGAQESGTAHFRGHGELPVTRHDGETLPAGTRLEGPAIIREPTTTVVYPGSRATVTEAGNYLIEVDPPDETAGAEAAAFESEVRA
jgi:N-methylhydantoinase A/oxoprolinase/acetone carboxylase beta subunit